MPGGPRTTASPGACTTRPDRSTRRTATCRCTCRTTGCLYFRQYQDASTQLHSSAFSSTFPGDFARDVARGSLPAVSWIVAPVAPQDMSEHPPAPPARGEYFTHQVLATLASNPSVWAKTVLFLSYDENDGFFDHVSPPTPPAGTPASTSPSTHCRPRRVGIRGPIGLGMRVPLLVLSPFARGGHVYSEVADHTSQLRFLEARFGVPVPNLSVWRRQATSDLTGSLDSSAPVGGLPPLPVTALDAIVVERECTASQQVELNTSTPPRPRPTASDDADAGGLKDHRTLSRRSMHGLRGELRCRDSRRARAETSSSGIDEMKSASSLRGDACP